MSSGGLQPLSDVSTPTSQRHLVIHGANRIVLGYILLRALCCSLNGTNVLTMYDSIANDIRLNGLIKRSIVSTQVYFSPICGAKHVQETCILEIRRFSGEKAGEFI